MLWVWVEKNINKETTFYKNLHLMGENLDSLDNFTNNFLYTLYNTFSWEPLIYDAIRMSLKMILLIALLVFVRGGIPRYRFDYLTKIGWIKILSIVLSIFIVTVLMIYFF